MTEPRCLNCRLWTDLGRCALTGAYVAPSGYCSDHQPRADAQPMFVGLTAAAPQEQPAAAPAIDWPSIWDHVGPWLLIASACAAAIIVTDYIKKGDRHE